MTPVAPELPIVFVHLMKCGGTSVRAALADAVERRRAGATVFRLDGRAAKTAVGGALDDDWPFRDALLSYTLLTQQPDVLMGHFRHRDRYAPLLDTAHFVTVLRDPLQRLLSLYRYRRFGDGVDLPTPRTLAEVLDSGRWDLEGHRYVSTFCGRDDLDPRSPEARTAALANLRRYAAVGNAADLDGFAESLSSLVGTTVTMPRLNQSPAPADASPEADPATLDRVAQLCAPDRALFGELFRAP